MSYSCQNPTQKTSDKNIVRVKSEAPEETGNEETGNETGNDPFSDKMVNVFESKRNRKVESKSRSSLTPATMQLRNPERCMGDLSQNTSESHVQARYLFDLDVIKNMQRPIVPTSIEIDDHSSTAYSEPVRCTEFAEAGPSQIERTHVFSRAADNCYQNNGKPNYSGYDSNVQPQIPTIPPKVMPLESIESQNNKRCIEGSNRNTSEPKVKDRHFFNWDAIKNMERANALKDGLTDAGKSDNTNPYDEPDPQNILRLMLSDSSFRISEDETDDLFINDTNYFGANDGQLSRRDDFNYGVQIPAPVVHKQSTSYPILNYYSGIHIPEVCDQLKVRDNLNATHNLPDPKIPEQFPGNEDISRVSEIFHPTLCKSPQRRKNLNCVSSKPGPDVHNQPQISKLLNSDPQMNFSEVREELEGPDNLNILTQLVDSKRCSTLDIDPQIPDSGISRQSRSRENLNYVLEDLALGCNQLDKHGNLTVPQIEYPDISKRCRRRKNLHCDSQPDDEDVRSVYLYNSISGIFPIPSSPGSVNTDHVELFPIKAVKAYKEDRNEDRSQETKFSNNEQYYDITFQPDPKHPNKMICFPITPSVESRENKFRLSHMNVQMSDVYLIRDYRVLPWVAKEEQVVGVGLYINTRKISPDPKAKQKPEFCSVCGFYHVPDKSWPEEDSESKRIFRKLFEDD